MFTRRTAVYSCALATVLVITACASQQITYEPATISAMRIDIKRPKEWEAARITNDPLYVDYIMNIKGDKGAIAGRIGISMIQPITPEEKVILADEMKGFKDMLKTKITDLTTIEEKDTTLLGLPAKYALMEYRSSENKTVIGRIAFTITVKDRTAYSIILEDDTTDFDVNLPHYREIADSMHWTVTQ